MTGVTLTSKMGYFVFDKTVPLSHAKLIRDSVVGQVFHPKSDAMKIRDEQDAHNYAKSIVGPAQTVQFELHMKGHEGL